MARMAPGDELKLQLDPAGQRANGKPWDGLGQVLRISDGEVALMMHGGNVPLEVTDGYQVTALLQRGSVSFCIVFWAPWRMFISEGRIVTDDLRFSTLNYRESSRAVCVSQHSLPVAEFGWSWKRTKVQ